MRNTKQLRDKLLSEGYSQQINEAMSSFLVSQGYYGSLPEALYKYLGDAGYKGQMSERLSALEADLPNLGGMPSGLPSLFANGEKGVWYDPSDRSTLWQDSARTTPVADYGDPVGAMDDKSGNGNHATQSTAAARPIYGRVPATGRRNLLTYTEDGSQWDVPGTAYGGDPAVRQLAPNAGGPWEYLVKEYPAGTGVNTSYYIGRQAEVKGVGQTRYVNLGATTAVWGEWFDLQAGEFLFGMRGDHIMRNAEALPDGWYRLTVVSEVQATVGMRNRIFWGSVAPTYTFEVSDNPGGDKILVRYPVYEVRPTADTSDIHYQRVGSIYDVTEDGVRSLAYLFDDGVDDALNATLPDLGSDATVAYASDQGVTIQTGQTIGVGSFDVLRDSMLFGMLVIDRALTTDETAKLTAWLNHKAGDFA